MHLRFKHLWQCSLPCTHCVSVYVCRWTVLCLAGAAAFEICTVVKKYLSPKYPTVLKYTLQIFCKNLEITVLKLPIENDIEARLQLLRVPLILRE